MNKLTKVVLDYIFKDVFEGEKDKKMFNDRFEKIMGYKIEKLYDYNFIRAIWTLKKAKRKTLKVDYEWKEKFYKERMTYFDENGNLKEEKIKEIEEWAVEETGTPIEGVTKESYNKEGKYLKENQDIEELFKEIETIQNSVEIFVDEIEKKVYITIMEWSIDYYGYGSLQRHVPKFPEYNWNGYGENILLLTEKRYWPKTKEIYKEMEEAAKKLLDIKKNDTPENWVYAYDKKDMFPYYTGGKAWTKYFLQKDMEIYNQYKDYKFVFSIFFGALITGGGDLLNPTGEFYLDDREEK